MAKNTRVEKLKEITDQLESGIEKLFESESYKDYLSTMSKFYNYSFNNTVLIYSQMPEATKVAGFKAWKTKFNRNVKKGETGIKIIAPCPFKITVEEDGQEVEKTIPSYRAVTVFDVSQTEGKPLPDIGPDEIIGDVAGYGKLFNVLENVSPVPVSFEDIKTGAQGYYSNEEKRIALLDGMSELQTVKTFIHEIAHAKLHDVNLEQPLETAYRPDRNTREIEAESIAYTVCTHYGLDTSDYSFGYIAGWSSGKELKELKGSLELIRETAAEIIDGINGYMKAAG